MSAKLKEFGSINSFREITIFLSDNENNEDFKNYIISISGFGDVICFGFKRNLMIASLICSYNSTLTSNGINLNVSFQEDVCNDDDDSEYITSMLVLPISSLKQSSQGLPDWTCICVGLSSGVVKFFNQSGQRVFSQKFNNSPIESICLRGSPRQNQHDIFTEDLMILCDNCCYQIDGIYLYESLNTFKKQLARYQAGFLDDQWDSFELGFRKWLLDPHESVSGMVFGFETCDTALDNIFNNVTNKGPFLVISEETSKYINCVIVGKVPFITFYKIPLESDSLDIGDLAHAVFSKVKGVLSTSISSWMGSFTSSESKQHSSKSKMKRPDSTASELPSRLQNRHVIEESSRQASMIIGCPHHNRQSKLTAMTDDFGRIFLLDIDDGIVIRMWKGYRDAQISITTTSDGSSTERSVNFLVIYAPRRSLIEVWTLPFGEKVASFDVRDKNGRLLHVPHASLEFNRTRTTSQKVKNAHSTFFLDSSGKISLFDIPFHLSLSTSSSERSQDHLILKHFKSMLKSESARSDHNVIRAEFSSSIRLLKLSTSIDLLMNIVLSLTFLPHDVIISVIDELVNSLSSGSLGVSSLDDDGRRLRTSWTGVKTLINGYMLLTSITSRESTHDDAQQNLGDLLKLESDDCERITNLSKYYGLYNQMARKLENDDTYLLFVNNFTMLPNSSEEEIEGFQLSKNALEKDILKIGTVVFKHSLHEQEQPVVDLLYLLMNQMKVDQSSCFRLCLSYLINENPTILMGNLGKVKELLTRILSPTSTLEIDLPNDYRLIKTSLQLSYELVEKSSNIMTSLLLAMTIRVIILGILQSGAIEKEEVASNLTEQLNLWNEICQRLEDLIIFDCFLKCCPLHDNKKRSKKVKVSFERELVLFNVLESGKGIFSERFSKWALKWNLRFTHINELYKSLASYSRTIVVDSVLEEPLLNTEVKDIFSILYKQLPHSLEYDSVLINVAWEYTRLWSQSLQMVEYLKHACELLENIGPAGGLVIQGVGSMIWDMYIVVGLAALFPADGTGGHQYSSHLASDVAANVIRFLRMLIKSLDSIDVIPTFSTEAVWQGDKSRSSLIDMAVNKELIVLPALELHIQLLCSMQLVSMLNIDNFVCQSLFGKETKKHIFKNLTTETVGDAMATDSVECRLSRLRFLERCINTCVKKFNEEAGEIDVSREVNSIVKLLAEKWLIDLDEILQCWIQNYYQFGLDSQASMYLDKVHDLAVLGVILLRVVGSRIKKEYLLPETKYYRECSKYVTPQLKRWLHSLDEALLRDTVITPLDRTAILLDQVLEWIPENCFDFESATCLQSVILNIQRTKKYLE